MEHRECLYARIGEPKLLDHWATPEEIEHAVVVVGFGIRWCDLCRQMHDDVCPWEYLEKGVEALNGG